LTVVVAQHGDHAWTSSAALSCRRSWQLAFPGPCFAELSVMAALWLDFGGLLFARNQLTAAGY
jgi:hypothetical protein